MFNVVGDRYTIFCGVDDLVLENVLFGATGWVCGLVNSFPKEAVRLFQLAREKKSTRLANSINGSCRFCIWMWM